MSHMFVDLSAEMFPERKCSKILPGCPTGQREALPSGKDPVRKDGGAPPSQPAGGLSHWPGEVQQSAPRYPGLLSAI